MDIQIEKVFVVRMTRLEAARTLVEPKPLLLRLRERLQSETDEPETIEGAVVMPLLSAKAGTGNRDMESAMPLTRKVMRRYRRAMKREKCPQYGMQMKSRGLKVHIACKHRSKERPSPEMEKASA